MDQSFKPLQTYKMSKQSQPIKKVTKARFLEMLNVLPPQRYEKGCFLVGEPYDHNGENNNPRFQMFISYNKKYYDFGHFSEYEFDNIIKEKDLFCDIS